MVCVMRRLLPRHQPLHLPCHPLRPSPAPRMTSLAQDLLLCWSLMSEHLPCRPPAASLPFFVAAVGSLVLIPQDNVAEVIIA